MAVYDISGNVISGGGDASVFMPDVSTNPYDKICRSINHRGWRGDGAVENSLDAFRASKAHGFYYAETDVRYTSDGIAILYHDDYINGTYVNNMTYAQVLAAVPTLAKFDDFIALCRNIGLHPYIEFKGTHTQEQVKALVDVVYSYQMQKKVTWFGGNVNVSKVKTLDPNARLGILSNTITATNISDAQALKLSTNEVFLDTWISNLTNDILTAVKTANIPLELYTFTQNASEITSMDSYITGFTSDTLIAGKVLYEANI